MNALSGIYGRVARARRAWFQPHRQRRLEHPVVSVGNLVLGGSGKTPVVAALARLLQELGERPAILSRGYGRRSGAAMTVVSEGRDPLVSVDASGDEPLMLARTLPGVAVIVCADRYSAGRYAEERLGATVHILDDGFQHLKLARDVDLLLVSINDLHERVLPLGRLREPIDSAAVADAVLVPGSQADRMRVQSALNASAVFDVVPTYGGLCRVQPFGGVADAGIRRVVGVAAIGRPERFFSTLPTTGLDVADTVAFRDHHWFDDGDIRRIEDVARANGAGAIVTTAKDAMRLEPLLSARSSSLPWAYLPYEVRIEPDGAFRAWLAERLRAARHSREARPT